MKLHFLAAASLMLFGAAAVVTDEVSGHIMYIWRVDISVFFQFFISHI